MKSWSLIDSTACRVDLDVDSNIGKPPFRTTNRELGFPVAAEWAWNRAAAVAQNKVAAMECWLAAAVVAG